MKKETRSLGALLTLAMLVGLLALPGQAAGEGYALDIAHISDQVWTEGERSITVYLNDQLSDPIQITATEGLGSPVLLAAPVYRNGEDTGETMGVTLVPIRLLSESMGIPIDWNNDERCAEITVKGKVVKLYPNAATITMPDGSEFKETEYTFPDGSPINLLLNRNDRLYMPVRAFCELVFEDAEFKWTSGMGSLSIYAHEADYTSETWVGVREIPGDFEEIVNLPNLKAFLEDKEVLINWSTHAVGLTSEDKYCGALLMHSMGIVPYHEYDMHGIVIENTFDGYRDDGTLYQFTEVALKDLISDPEDIKSIMEMMKDSSEIINRNVGGDEDAYDADLETWREKYGNKTFELNTVIVEVGNNFRIYNKE